MISRIILVLVLLLSPSFCLGEMNPYYAGVQVATATSCALLSDSFTGSDGTDITSAGWTADGTDPGNLLELDTAQFNDTTSSLLVTHGTSDATAYKTFTEQTSGIVTITMFFRFSNVSTGEQGLIIITDGTLSVPTTLINLRRFEDDLKNYNGSTWDTVATSVFTADTWHKIQVDIDLSADTFDTTIDESLESSDTACTNTDLDPDRINIKVFVANLSNTMWGDTLCIE